MERLGERIGNELIAHVAEWNRELLVEGHDQKHSIEILAKVLLWGGAWVTAYGVDAAKNPKDPQRLALEGFTQGERQVLDGKCQQILDRFWPIVREELVDGLGLGKEG